MTMVIRRRNQLFTVAIVLAVWLCCPSAAQAQHTKPTQEVTLLYSNDFHAAVAPITATWLVHQPKVGGALDFAGWIEMLRRTEPNVFLFDSGDLYTGQAISFLSRGRALVDIWKAIGFDAACLGNHEFDYGIAGALREIQGEPFPVLASNLFYKRNGAPFAKPYAILARNGVRVAVIGVFGPETKLTTTIATWDTLEVRDPLPILQRLVPELHRQTDLVVVLAHEGLPGPMQSDAEAHPEVQRSFDTDKTLVAGVPRIDALISGHPHRGIEVPWVSPETGSIVVQTYGLGTTLGFLQITLDVASHRVVSHHGALLRVTDGIFLPPDKVARAVHTWEARAATEGKKPIGEASTAFTRDYNHESRIGALITDAMLSGSGAQMAFINAGGIRGDLPGGLLTRNDVISALPFVNTLVEMD